MFVKTRMVMMMKKSFITKVLLKLPVIGYKLKQAHYDLLTQTGEEFLDEKKDAWQEYPRPQMRREGYQILNGTWKLNGKDICMPFPPQSILSGYGQKVEDHLTYEKVFELLTDLKKERVLIHFGAVDQTTEVYVNNVLVGTNEGGYLPFSCDITSVVKKGENLLVVKATDTLSKDYPYGKQTQKRGGMWYTPVSGIWQTVWIEYVPENYIENIKLATDLNGVDIEVKMAGDVSEDEMTGVATVCGGGIAASKAPDLVSASDKGFTIALTLENGQIVEKEFEGNTGRLDLTSITLEDGSRYEPILWTLENPHLYEMRIITKDDAVDTYFALRTINIEDRDGKKRVCLNGKPVFLHGVLDQGYYSDGIYLPAEASEYTKDILRMKELGVNLLRKHIKVEPDIFYYECDRLGMLVMQDMVNSGPYSFIKDTALPTVGLKKRSDSHGKISGKRKEFFIRHSEATIKQLYNHPCIVAYTIFNEGWGQFHSDEVYDMVKEWDPTRLIDSTSGWFWQEKNDFDSEHIYFKVIPLQPKERPLFVSECGGYTMAVKDHMYSKYASYGYGIALNEEMLTDKIIYMYENMILPFIKDGVCGCIYTQLSDVEDEINGLYTYDRKVCKVNKEKMCALAQRLLKEL